MLILRLFINEGTLWNLDPPHPLLACVTGPKGRGEGSGERGRAMDYDVHNNTVANLMKDRGRGGRGDFLH